MCRGSANRPRRAVSWMPGPPIGPLAEVCPDGGAGGCRASGEKFANPLVLGRSLRRTPPPALTAILAAWDRASNRGSCPTRVTKFNAGTGKLDGRRQRRLGRSPWGHARTPEQQVDQPARRRGPIEIPKKERNSHARWKEARRPGWIRSLSPRLLHLFEARQSDSRWLDRQLGELGPDLRQPSGQQISPQNRRSSRRRRKPGRRRCRRRRCPGR